MKRAFLVCCIVVLAVIGLSCTTGGALGISVTETDDGIVIGNTGNVDCIVIVTSPDGEQQFELAVGENMTVTDMSQPVGVSAVSLRK